MLKVIIGHNNRCPPVCAVQACVLAQSMLFVLSVSWHSPCCLYCLCPGTMLATMTERKHCVGLTSGLAPNDARHCFTREVQRLVLRISCGQLETDHPGPDLRARPGCGNHTMTLPGQLCTARLQLKAGWHIHQVLHSQWACQCCSHDRVAVTVPVWLLRVP